MAITNHMPNLFNLIRSILFLTFLITGLFSHAQKRQFGKILNDLQNGKRIEALEKIEKLESKYISSPAGYHLRYLYYYVGEANISNADSAAFYFQKSIGSLEKLTEKERVEICEDLGLCDSVQEKLKNALDQWVYKVYIATHHSPTIEKFIKQYPGNNWTYQAKLQIDSLDFETADQKADIQSYETYIDTHGSSSYNSIAQTKIEAIAFDVVVKKNKIEDYETYLSRYPSSTQYKDVELRMIRLHWIKDSSTLNKEVLRKFMTEFPQSIYVNEAKNLILEIDWSEADLKNTTAAFENFLQNYPNSKYTNKAQSKLENIAWSDALKANTADQFQVFIKKFPNSVYYEEAGRKYESLHVNVFPYLTKNRKYKLLNVESNQYVVDDEFGNIEMAGKDLFVVSKFNKVGMINKSGKQIIPITYNCIEKCGSVMQVKLGEKYALFTMNGEKLTDFNYDYLNYKLGYIVVRNDVGNGDVKYGLVGINGQSILLPEYESIDVISNNKLLVTKDKMNYLIDETGTALSSKYKTVTDLNPYFRVEQNGKFGLMDNNGKLIIPINYENILVDSPFCIFTNKLKQEGIMDLSGNIILNAQPNSLSCLGNGMYSMDIGNKSTSFSLYNAMLKRTVGSAEFEWISDFSSGYSYAGKSGKTGVIDMEGKWIISPVYEESLRYNGMQGDGEGYGEHQGMEDGLYPESICSSGWMNNSMSYYTWDEKYISKSDQLAVVQMDTSFGFSDLKGNIKIPIIYSNVKPFLNGVAEVSRWDNGTYLTEIIDTEGRVLVSGFSLVGFFNLNQDVLLHASNAYKVLNLSTKKIQETGVGLNYELLEPFGDYWKSSYKNYPVYHLTNGEILMDQSTVFAAYDFNQKLNEALMPYYSGNYSDAISLLKNLLNEYPNNLSIIKYIGYSYLENKDYYYANRYFGDALQLDPNAEEIRSKRVEINYFHLKNFRNCLEDLNYLINNFSTTNSDYYFKRAYTHGQLGDTEASLNDYNIAIQNNPNNSIAYNNRSLIYQSKRMYEKALSDLTQAIRVSDKDDKVNLGLFHSNKGNVFHDLKRKTEACIEWNKAKLFGNNNSENLRRANCK
jgi:tetratricopeptide (TPR) repeat protein